MIGRWTRRPRSPSAALAAAAVLALVTASGCSEERDYAQATAVLVDISGTYAEQKGDVVRFVKTGILPDLLPGDSLFVITIDDLSYEQDNVVSSIKLDMRPSVANTQKLALATDLDAFARSGRSARHTDIRGAMMLASELLKETEAHNKNIVVFSDLEEELPAGARREFAPAEFESISVLAMNVKKLGPDNRDPNRYRSRLAMWEQRVLDNGANGWRVIVSPVKLVEVLAANRG
jgi:hypothetical protein